MRVPTETDMAIEALRLADWIAQRRSAQAGAQLEQLLEVNRQLVASLGELLDLVDGILATPAQARARQALAAATQGRI